MKKIVAGLSVFFILALGVVYFFSQRPPEILIESDISLALDKEEKPNPKGTEPSTKVEVSKETPKKMDPVSSRPKTSFPEALSEEEVEELDELLAHYEEEWDKDTRNFFLNELKLSEEDYEDYLMMRDGFEEDRVEAFQEFHNRMASEKGSSYSYSPTAEMVENEERIRGEYLKLFKERYGEEAFVKYSNLLEGYNDRIRREADPKHGVLRIDF
ncbi:MAG: hypothetical protein VXV96_16130 [Bdellovibrionota bacterium]|nr:hypothetical protein [Bdellovibrionota bacterium]